MSSPRPYIRVRNVYVYLCRVAMLLLLVFVVVVAKRFAALWFWCTELMSLWFPEHRA